MNAEMPQTLGPFKVLAKLGQGGMGTVYKALHETLGRTVALKVLSPEFSSHHEYVTRFLREARTLASIDHPNIIKIYDSGDLKGQYYIAMELVDGGSLLAVADARKKIDEAEALKLMLQAARGLGAAHARGLIHRDIKPENLLLGTDGILRIVDFGLAADSSANMQLTQAGACLGTPMYMSPEQADGEVADPRSDLYSLGGTFFRVLTGRPPFVSATVMNLLYKQKFEQVPDPQSLRPELSRSISDLLLHLLGKRREDRPADAAALISMIEKLLAGKEIPAPPPFVPLQPRSPRTESQMGLSMDGETAELFGSAGSRSPRSERLKVARSQSFAVAGTLLVIIAALTVWGIFGGGASIDAVRTTANSPQPQIRMFTAEEIKDRLAAGDAEFKAGRISEARAIYLDALKGAPENVELAARRDRADRRIKFNLDMARGEKFERDNRFSEALVQYGEASALAEPDDEQVAQGRIERVKTALKKMEKPLADFSPAPPPTGPTPAEERAKKASSLAANAESFLQLKDYAKAETAFTQAAEAADEPARQSLVNKAKHCKKARRLIEAQDFDARGESAQALVAYKQALELEPDETAAAKVKEIEQRIESDKTRESQYEAALREGQTALDAGNLTEARVKFTVAQALKPLVSTPAAKLNEIDARELFAKADAAQKDGDLKLARQMLSDAIAKNPALESQVDIRLKTLETAPSRSQLALKKTIAAMATRNYDDAFAILDSALKVEPESDLLLSARQRLVHVKSTESVSEGVVKAIAASLEKLKGIVAADEDEAGKRWKERFVKLQTSAEADVKSPLQLFIKEDFVGTDAAVANCGRDADEVANDLAKVAEHYAKLAEKVDEKVGLKVPLLPKIGMGGDHKKAERYRQLAAFFQSQAATLKPARQEAPTLIQASPEK